MAGGGIGLRDCCDSVIRRCGGLQGLFKEPYTIGATVDVRDSRAIFSMEIRSQNT